MGIIFDIFSFKLVKSFKILKKLTRSKYLFNILCSFLVVVFFTPFISYAEESSVIVNNSIRDKWPSCDSSDSQKISFVHISDMHANYNPDQNRTSPVGRIKGYYEQVKKENPFVVLTDAGDDYEKGSIAEELSRGQTTREVVNAMRYDVRTLGNHDLAWGIEELLKFSHDQSAAVLASNTRINFKDSGINDDANSPGWTDFAVLTVGCVRIGFLGLLSKPWDENGRQYEGSFYSEIPELQTDFNFVEIARDIIAKHRQEVDILVLVSHLGLYDDIAIAEQTDGIDLILGGHTHSILKTPKRVKNTSIVHVGSNAEYVGRFDLDFDLHNKTITNSHYALVDNRKATIPTDKSTEEVIAKILHRYQRDINEPMIEVSQDLTKKNMAFIAARAAAEQLNSDAALVSADTVWQKWPQGAITRQDILNGFKVEREPSGSSGQSSLYLIEVTGEDLLLASASLANFAYWGPSRIDPIAFYTLAIQKAQALNQQEYFGKKIALLPPKPVAEIWETVVDFAYSQKAKGFAIDGGFKGQENNSMIAFMQKKGTQSPVKDVVRESL